MRILLSTLVALVVGSVVALNLRALVAEIVSRLAEVGF